MQIVETGAGRFKAVAPAETQWGIRRTVTLNATIVTTDIRAFRWAGWRGANRGRRAPYPRVGSKPAASRPERQEEENSDD